jgi:hypothetical protein
MAQHYHPMGPVRLYLKKVRDEPIALNNVHFAESWYSPVFVAVNMEDAARGTVGLLQNRSKRCRTYCGTRVWILDIMVVKNRCVRFRQQDERVSLIEAGCTVKEANALVSEFMVPGHVAVHIVIKLLG